MRIAIIGCGHVGLVTGGCLALLGHKVTCVDRDRERVALLEGGHVPIFESYLEELFLRSRDAGTLKFTCDSAEAVKEAEVIFLCVGVPQLDTGDSNFSALDTAARQIALAADAPKLIVVRSTVPVQTGDQLKHLLSVYGRKPDVEFSLATNPQFLREGTAVEDFLHAERILIGVDNPFSATVLSEIYAPIVTQKFHCPIHPGGCPPHKSPELLITSIRSAEMIKHATNAFLAIKISYSNVLADLCERLGANVQEVTRAMGLDPRIRASFLDAGIGFGGSRLPKDLRAFCYLTERAGIETGILQAAEAVNLQRTEHFFQKVNGCLWVLKDKRIGLLGLAHKAGTDDIRGSPAIELFKRFRAAGAEVHAYDPQAITQARGAYPDMTCGIDAYDVAERADALVVATDWKEFLELDWKRICSIMARPTVFDGRNLLSPPQMKALGFEYYSVGRPGS